MYSLNLKTFRYIKCRYFSYILANKPEKQAKFHKKPHFLFAYFCITKLPIPHYIMKKILIISLICSCLFNLNYSQSINHINLGAGWKFHIGDSLIWKSPDYDDSEWIEVLPFSYWDYLHDYDYDGYAWYRLTFFMPSSMKEGLSENDSIYFHLGRIDDNDETFLNGNIIGRNAENVTPGIEEEFANIQLKYNLTRKYQLPVKSNMIKWDTVNTLAIRVYDIWLTAGLYAPNPLIYNKYSWEGNIAVHEKTGHPLLLTLGEYADVSFIAENKDPFRKLNATFITDIFAGKYNQPVFTQKKDITVDPGKSNEVTTTFPNLVEDYYHVSYKIIENTSNYSFSEKEFLGLKKEDIHVLDQSLEPIVKDKVKPEYLPLHQGHTHINGFLGNRLDVNMEKGLCLFPEQFVEPYFTGKEPLWPVGEIGKTVHGGTKMLLYEENKKLLEVMQSIVQVWVARQQSDGYLGTYKPENRWTTWDVWDHKYVMQGLIQFYSITGYKPALQAAKKIGNLMIETFGKEEGKMDIIANGPHAGMASGSILEPMVYLYKYTGEKKYLDFCQYIVDAFEQENGPQIVTELTQRSGTVYKVGNGKGYEMLSCIIGLVQMYKVTGHEELLDAAKTAWEDIAKNRLYITGTATEFEHFQEKEQLNAGREHHMGEGCVTSHWMYLSKELFKLTGEQKYIDEIDKSLYNHLLAAQHPENGLIVYYTPLQDAKWYMPFDLNVGPPPCCHLSVKRCISEIPEFSFYQNENELGINLYNPANLEISINNKGKEIPVKITINSEFPYEGDAELDLSLEKSTTFTLALRVPDWCENFTAHVGEETLAGEPGKYLNISRKWEKSDLVKVFMDFPIRILEGGRSYPEHYAIKYGPQVLAVDGDVNNLDDMEVIFFDTSVEPTLELYEGEMPEGWVGKQSFVSNALKTKDGKDVVLVPFSDASQTGGDVRVWIKRSTD